MAGTVIISPERVITIDGFDFGHVTQPQNQILGLRWAILQVTEVFERGYPNNEVDYEGQLISGPIVVTYDSISIFGVIIDKDNPNHDELSILSWAHTQMGNMFVKMRG